MRFGGFGFRRQFGFRGRPTAAPPAAGGSGIQYVGGKTLAFAGTTSNTDISLTDLTGGIAAAPAENDIIIVTYCVGGQVDRNLAVNTADYTEVADIYANGTIDCNLAVFLKRAGASPDTTVQVGGTGAATDAGAVAIQVWRGVNTTTAQDVAAATATGTGTGRPDPPSRTPSTAGAVVIVCGGGGHNNVSSGFAQSGSELSNFITTFSADNFNCDVGMGSFAWTSGSFDPVGWVGGSEGASYSWAAVTLVLRPA